MMASRRLNKRQTNAVLAVSMGMTIALAVAFFVIAMPRDILEAAVSVTGLPAIFAGAQPPLGNTARLLIAAFGAGLAGVMVLAIFLLTDRQPARKPEKTRPEKTESGSPFFPDFDLPAERAPAPSINIPTFKRSATAEPETHPIETVEVTEIAEPIEPAELFEPPVAREPEEVEREPIAQEGPIFLDFRAFRAAAQPSNDPAPLDLGRWTIPDAEEPVQPRPITAPASGDEQESISQLMARLEAGLARRSVKGTAAAQAPAIDRSGVGLKSTLDELRKMAVRR